MKKIVIFLFVAIPLCASNDLTYLLNFLQQPYESGHQYFEKKNRMNSNYEDVINHALDRRFALQILPTYTASTDAYDDCGCKLPLGQYLFGQCLFLENIYLPSLLSKQGVIFPTDTTKSPCEQFLTQLAV
ncbi:MAG: hypothetical protein WD068_03235 [Candidatus Babeliales bacterium]